MKSIKRGGGQQGKRKRRLEQKSIQLDASKMYAILQQNNLNCQIHEFNSELYSSKRKEDCLSKTPNKSFTKRTRCQNGSRKNKKTGLCEKKNTKLVIEPIVLNEDRHPIK